MRERERECGVDSGVEMRELYCGLLPQTMPNVFLFPFFTVLLLTLGSLFYFDLTFSKYSEWSRRIHHDGAACAVIQAITLGYGFGSQLPL
jgi:hypothetical protein